jgi:hypothetical protein
MTASQEEGRSRTLAKLRSSLGNKVFDAEWELGQMMSLEQSLTQAVELLNSVEIE